MIKPTRNNILVEFDIDPEQTKGGIFVPEDSRSEKKFGTIIKSGNEVKNLKDGDRILLYTHPSHCGEKLEYEGKKYYLVQEQDIVALVTGE